MSTTTSIEWTDVTWNPVRGCSLVSAGCANCYAMKQAHRFSRPGQPYAGLTALGPQGPRWTGKVTLVPDALDEPLHWRKPRRVFVNSMSDLFHEAVPDEFVHQVFAVMASASRHTFQILTKRQERMRQWVTEFPQRDREQTISWRSWPLPNVQLGVSIEDQATADARIPILLETPAAVRFVSAEPLLGPTSFRWATWDSWKDLNGNRRRVVDQHDGLRMLNWVIVGGESGPGARPCDVRWIRTIVEQCQEGGVPVFVKQLGSHVIDRNDAGFEGDDPRAWPMDTRIQEHPFGYDAEYQGAPVRLRLRDRKGGDMAEWPEELRVREFPL